ncbi:hypothetical protein Aperf_G00000035473 [Anoplocephala perfoliata]
MSLNFTKYRKDTSFVIRNMTMSNGNETFTADSSPKFTTALTKKFVCSSEIEIPMGNDTFVSMVNTTLQAFNMNSTGEIERCPRDMKVEFPVVQVTSTAVSLAVGGLVATFAGLIGLFWGVNPTGMMVDASGKEHEKEGAEAINLCLRLLNLTSEDGNSTYEKFWQSIPSYRFLGVCPQDPTMVGSLVEMQSHLSFLYLGRDNKMRCRIVVVAPSKTPPPSNFPAMVPRNASRLIEIYKFKEIHERNYTSTVIISELDMTYCDNRTRKMGVYLYPVDGNSQPSALEFTWRRKPEYYEDSEFGWSSVGAHLGALSGIFSLAEVKLKFDLSYQDIHKSDVVATSGSMERFRARAGDFYQCASRRNILLTTYQNGSEGNHSRLINNSSTVYVILTTRNIRLQSFGDLNQNGFMGAGVTCGDDVHGDQTVTIGIGSSICIIVVISLIGIAMTRLYDRDKELQSYELEYSKMTSKGLLPVVQPSHQSYEMWIFNKNKSGGPV